MSEGQKLVASILHFGFIKTNTENPTMSMTNTRSQNYKTAIKSYTPRQAAVLLSQPQTVLDTPAPQCTPIYRVSPGCHLTFDQPGPVELLRLTPGTLG